MWDIIGMRYLKRCGDTVSFSFIQFDKNRKKKEVATARGGNLLVGQGSTEMLLDVGLQHCVKMLELSVSNQTNDVYLADTRRK